MVFVPVSNGTPKASQGDAPVAVPLPPPEVCHVIRDMPCPPDAVPATEMLALLEVVTAEDGEVIATETGAPLAPWVAVTGGISVTVAVCVAVCRAASNAVTLTEFAPFTSGTLRASQPAAPAVACPP